MEALWFAIAVLVFTVYVVLDGFDFGAGALHLLVARSDGERRQLLAAIGPFWDGNEVWLLAGGGVLFLSFPKVLAAGLSGLYLAVFMLLWVLILRGIAIEFRSHVPDGMWRAFWDSVFSIASTLAPVLLGAALGNVVRGVPLAADGWFGLPLFDSFSPHGALGILDWYTVVAGVTALAVLAHHGALFLAWKTDGDVSERSRGVAARLFPVVVALWLASAAGTFLVAPALMRGVAERPVAIAATLVACAGLATSFVARRRLHDLAAFLGSATFVSGVLAATAASLFPVWLRSTVDPALSLTATNAAAAPESLRAGLLWWPFGLALAVCYTTLIFRHHRGKAHAAAEGEGY
jgi:cytochrome d ubiquinol oxidase subunit II